MPFSNQDGIPTVLQFAEQIRPRRVLDVGVGLGIYGLLLRTRLDIAFERLARETWQVQIDGLEIFPAYRNPVWSYAYDEVHLGDVRTHPLPPNSYDLVVLNDVIEHLEETEAIACMHHLLAAAPTVIVTTPAGHITQGAWGGNLHETHRSLIRPNQLPHLVATKRTGLTFCCVCCRDPALSKRIRWEAQTVPVSRPEWLPYIIYRLRRKGRSIQRKLGLRSPGA